MHTHLGGDFIVRATLERLQDFQGTSAKGFEGSPTARIARSLSISAWN
jgi:hypothetical protein